ncbi:hypothetical protein DFH09DRAFT_1077576 [Mycena vulgaris]|nr:hypothetical protein DFH09DRAFT_1077576 [Mycena vulgaris]
MPVEQRIIAVFGDSGSFAFNYFLGAISLNLAPLLWEAIRQYESPRKQLIVDNNLWIIDILDPPGGMNLSQNHSTLALKVWVRDVPPPGGPRSLDPVTSRASFDSIEAHLHLVCQIKGQNTALVLLGRKCDDGVGRNVSQEEGEALGQRLGCPFLEVSAKTALNIDLAFADPVRLLRQKDVKDRSSVHVKKEKKKKKKRNMECIIL